MEQEERCLPSVFRSRELNKEEEQEKGKWLLWCLHLPLFTPPKETDLISLRQLPKNLTGIQRKKPLFSHLQTWLKKQPLALQEEKTPYC